MRAGGAGTMIDAYMTDAGAMEVGMTGAGERLPWILATPIIGGLSLGLWVGIWQLARLMLPG